MSGYFSRKNDEPDTEPFRRFYAEGGYVGDTSHDIDDVEAGLYESQKFAGGGKVEGYANGGLIRKLLASVTEPLRAYHGTPHKFDKFDASKIGTGEGAQAYGHGLYFAENPAVAQQYRDNLAGRAEIDRLKLGDMILGPHNGFDYSRNAGRSNYDNIYASLAEDLLIDEAGLVGAPNVAEFVLSKLDDKIAGYRDEWPEAVADAMRLRTRLSRPGAVSLKMGEQPGAMYEVGLQIPREALLSWDAPLTPEIQAVLPPKVKKNLQPNKYTGGDPTGESLYGAYSETYPGDYAPRMSEELLDAGIPGLRYLDGGSRMGGVGTENFVMFPGTEELINIQRRYAEGGEVEPEGYANGGLIRKFLESVKAPLKAWHGTPHNVEKFDASKIGTGEGAQVYGHGMYFAENPEVAKWYRETLSGDPYWVHGSESVNPLDVLQQSGLNQDHLFDVGNTILDGARVGAADETAAALRALYPEGVVDSYANFIRDNLKLEKPGNLYEVGVHAPRNTLLSWDEPLSRQPEPVIEALDRFGIKPDVQGLRDFDDALLNNLHAAPGKGRPLPKQPWDPTGGQLYESSKIVPGGYRDPVAASEALLEAGIPGIRYRDGMSRARGAGTHNYVMFPGTEDLIEILGRYAEGGEVKPRGHFSSGHMESEPEGYANGGLIRKWLKAVGDTMRQPLGVAVPDEVLPKVIEDGRFKSLFEAGTSGGSKSTERRGKTELNMFGVPLDADPTSRPIYGHLFHPEEPKSIADQYGDWISVLHPSVKNRATVTWGDSLDSTPDMNLGPYRFDQRPAEILRPRAQDNFSLRRGELYRDIPEDFRSLVQSEDVWWPGYLEAQIHGGLPWSDVTNLISVPAATPDAALRAADRFGKPVFAQDALTENFPEPWLRAMPGASKVDELIDGLDLSLIGYEEGGQVEEEEDTVPRGYFGGC